MLHAGRRELGHVADDSGGVRDSAGNLYHLHPPRRPCPLCLVPHESLEEMLRCAIAAVAVFERWSRWLLAEIELETGRHGGVR